MENDEAEEYKKRVTSKHAAGKAPHQKEPAESKRSVPEKQKAPAVPAAATKELLSLLDMDVPGIFYVLTPR